MERLPLDQLPRGVTGGFKTNEDFHIPGLPHSGEDDPDVHIDICPTIEQLPFPTVKVRIRVCLVEDCGAVCWQNTLAPMTFQVICRPCADRYMPGWRGMASAPLED